MKQKLNVALMLGAGLLGALFTRYMTPTPVSAQNQTSPPLELRAQSFTLVDVQNHTIGSFAFEPLPSVSFPRPGFPGTGRPQFRIVLRDSSGREIWSASNDPVRPLSEGQ
jgi:hypothetical protein